MSEQQLAFHAPVSPRDLEEAGLPLVLSARLCMKAMYVHGLEAIAELSDFLGVSSRIVAHIVTYLEDRKFVETAGKEGVRTAQMRYRLSHEGRQATAAAIADNHYVGPLPVSLAEYAHQVSMQGLSLEGLRKETLREKFLQQRALVIPEKVLDLLGPALTSGHSCLMFGPPGNGKSVVASAVAHLLTQSIAIPYAILVGGEVVRVFDPLVHRRAEPVDELVDPSMPAFRHIDKRWVLCRRPFVVTGGELKLSMLDITHNRAENIFDAPLQTKANGGVILLDDLGREVAAPAEILNRWITPLEFGFDILSLATGETFQVPFDAFVIFSTNLDMSAVFDLAMRRRIHYKINFSTPSRQDIEEISLRVFEHRPREEVLGIVAHVYARYYDTGVLQPARFHPKWIKQHVENHCRYEGRDFEATPALIASAFENL